MVIDLFSTVPYIGINHSLVRYFCLCFMMVRLGKYIYKLKRLYDIILHKCRCGKYTCGSASAQ